MVYISIASRSFSSTRCRFVVEDREWDIHDDGEGDQLMGTNQIDHEGIAW